MHNPRSNSRNNFLNATSNIKTDPLNVSQCTIVRCHWFKYGRFMVAAVLVILANG